MHPFYSVVLLLGLLNSPVAALTRCPDDPLCKICSISPVTNELVCQGCQNSYFNHNSKECRIPRVYLTNCITYDSNIPTRCSECYYGFFVDESGQCVSCPENCWKCTNERTCLSCYQERIPLDGDCKAMRGPKCDQEKVKNCEFCGVGNSCFKCRYGFALNEEGKCESSTPNCQDLEEGNCRQCWHLYFLTSDFRCSVINKNRLAWYIFMVVAFVTLGWFGHSFFRKENKQKRRLTEDSYVSIMSNLK